MTFQQKLEVAAKKNNSLVCVGLDSAMEFIPRHLKKENYPQFEFNKAIIDATYDLLCAYKPNAAFYESLGADGITQLKMTCEYINQMYPQIPIILDAKRADIGNTNIGYITFAFSYLEVDAITLHPYLGKEALQPFLDRSDKGCVILCRTSNPGGVEFQDLLINSEPLYKVVAKKVVTEWNKNKNCLLVTGATFPRELAEIRNIVGDMTLLVPGIGAQGGAIEQTVKAGLNSKNAGMIISASRSVIFASNGKDFSQKAREEACSLRAEINNYRN